MVQRRDCGREEEREGRKRMLETELDADEPDSGYLETCRYGFKGASFRLGGLRRR